MLVAEESFLELHHARVGEQQRRIMGRQQPAAGDNGMPSGFEKGQKQSPYIVGAHWESSI